VPVVQKNDVLKLNGISWSSPIEMTLEIASGHGVEREEKLGESEGAGVQRVRRYDMKAASSGDLRCCGKFHSL